MSHSQDTYRWVESLPAETEFTILDHPGHDPRDTARKNGEIKGLKSALDWGLSVKVGQVRVGTVKCTLYRRSEA